MNLVDFIKKQSLSALKVMSDFVQQTNLNKQKPQQSPTYFQASSGAHPITYDINCIEQIVQDCAMRHQIFDSYYNIWDKRVKLEFMYAEKLQQLTAFPLQFSEIQKPSQKLYQSLIKIFDQEAVNRMKLAQQLENQIMKKLRQEIQISQKDYKKYTTLGKSLKKDIDYDAQALQKSRAKFYKKITQLEKMKLDYITFTLAADRDFQKKNKLFLKIKESEEEALPLKKQYQTLTTRYNESVSIFTSRISEVIKKLQYRQIQILKSMKEHLINSELFHSALGAILVHGTQRSLRYLDQIMIQNHELKRHNIKQLEQQKKCMEKIYNNPAQYIEELFKKVEDNRIQDIIRYGQNFQYKNQLSQYFQNLQQQQTEINYKNFKQISDYTIRIIQIFRTVFQSKQKISDSILMQFQQLIKNRPNLRKDFIMCLQKYRLQGKFQIHKENLKNIIEIIKVFLNICNQEFDTFNSKQFMVLSFTYYFTEEEENGKKIDLQQFIKTHPIWQNLKWWECGLLQSVYEQNKMKLNKKNESSASNCISIWDIKGTGVKKFQGVEEGTLTNICFNQLAYYVHNMQLFDIQMHEIIAYANKFIKIFGLSTKMANSIASMCNNSELKAKQ